MKANPHFIHFKYHDEQELVQDIHDEVIQILGINCSYIPKEHFDYDLIMGEDSDQRFTKSYLIEMKALHSPGFRNAPKAGPILRINSTWRAKVNPNKYYSSRTMAVQAG